MKTTYNEILNTMRNAYYEKCGEKAELHSDIGARFQAVASELFSLACYGDYILKQAFVQSATGEHLDFHAELRGIKRKTPSKAEGELVFSITEPSQENIEIPFGTVCSVYGKPFIQFETTENAVLFAGQTEVSVPSRALREGSEYNAEAGSVSVMVNPPSGIESVTNASAFCGGCNEENDTALRKRILESYRIPQTGYSPKSVRELILKNEEVLDCAVLFQNSKYTVYAKTKSGEISNELTRAVRDSLVLLELTPYTLRVLPAEALEFGLTVEIKASLEDREKAISQLEKKITELCGGLTIGENLNLNMLAYSVAETLRNSKPRGFGRCCLFFGKQIS